jgi:molybdenum cofactor cytidylyltransferase
VVTAVVLAAGASTRMGEHKLLLPLGGEPIVRRTVREVCGAGFDDVVVVLGRGADRVREAIGGLPCRAVINPDYERGMGTSFRSAVATLTRCDAALFALADQPFVTAAHYRQVRDAWDQGRPLIVGVRYGTVMAPPHLFGRELFAELSTLENGARPVLERHAARARMLDFPADLLMDIDTPDDYRRAQALASGGSESS